MTKLGDSYIGKYLTMEYIKNKQKIRFSLVKDLSLNLLQLP